MVKGLGKEVVAVTQIDANTKPIGQGEGGPQVGVKDEVHGGSALAAGVGDGGPTQSDTRREG